MPQYYVQDAAGNYVAVPDLNGHHHHVGGHGPYPGYHGHSGVNPYPATHSYGYGIPGGSAYGYYNAPHGTWLGHDWIGLPRYDLTVSAMHQHP